MKICPACGADVLDSSTVRCSSCGTDMTKDDATRTGENAREPLDDTSPIKPSADLELVTRGNAFWAETQPESAGKPAARSEKLEDTEKQNNQKPESAKSGQPVKNAPAVKDGMSPVDEQTARIRAGLLERTPSGAPAPTLAELAKKRREEMGSEPRRTKDPDDSDDRGDFDATRPAGIKTRPEKPVRAAAAVSSSSAAASPDQAVAMVSRSHDIAFIEGRNLSIPGMAWTVGENVVVQGKTYQLKRKAAKYPISPMIAAYVGGGILVGCLMMWMLASGGAAATGSILGMVRDASTGKMLSGVTVAIEDAGKTSQSDPSGLFAFDELADGIYTVIATDPIYGKQRRSVTVAKGAASVLLDLEREVVAEAEPPAPIPVEPEKAPETDPSHESAEGPGGHGELAVTSSVPNSKVFIDGKMLGVGNTVYSGIKAGSRAIRVEHEGFTPWVKTVDIQPGKLTRIEPKLSNAEPPAPQQLSPDQYAAAGRKLLEQKQYAGAIEQFTMALKGAQRAQFFAWRADAYVGQKKLQAAEADFLAAYEMFKQSSETGKLDDLLERAVLVVPASAPLRVAYGDYLYSHGKLQDAVKNYRKALQMGADPTKTNIAIGLAQYAGGGYEEANTSWTIADEASAGVNPQVAGYLALSSARLQYRASCRNAVRRLRDYPDVLSQFREHPDWEKVQHLTGEG